MFLEINGNSIYYEIHGSGIPVITIHGYGVDHNIMKGFMERFIPKDKYKRIYFDLPGFGKSEITQPIAGAEEMYDTLRSFIRKIIGDEKYILIGLSYGGYLSRKLVKDEPDKIYGVMFVCSLITKTADENSQFLNHRIMYNDINDKAILDGDVYREFAEVAVFASMESYLGFKEHICPGKMSGDMEWRENYYRHGYRFSVNIDDIKKPFDKPALFIMGRQDHWVYYKDLDTIIDNYSRASVCLIDEGGHNVEYEKPELVEAFARDWLQRIERFTP